MEQVALWIRTVVIIVLVMTVTEHLLPSKQYKEYLKLYGGLLLVFITLRFFAVFAGQEQWLEGLTGKAWKEQASVEQRQLKQKLDAEDNPLLMEAYGAQIGQYIEEYLEKDGWEIREVKVSFESGGVDLIQVWAKEDSVKGDVKQEKEQLAKLYQLEEKCVEIRLVQ